MLLVGRYIVGFGGGMMLANTPVYTSEISPAHSRGMLVGLQGNFVTFGYVVSSCAALGFHFVDGSYQWRLNFVIATAVALALLFSLLGLLSNYRIRSNFGRIELRKVRFD
jgi:MFS family permease